MSDILLNTQLMLLDRAASPRRVRLVTHLDVDVEDVDRAAKIILEVMSA